MPSVVAADFAKGRSAGWLRRISDLFDDRPSDPHHRLSVTSSGSSMGDIGPWVRRVAVSTMEVEACPPAFGTRSHRTGHERAIVAHGRAPVLLLTTTGRRTGRQRTVPLLYVHDDTHFVVCNVNPGFERPNPWVLNLRADSHALVRLGRDTFAVTAREASDAELERVWPRLTQLWPAYHSFHAQGGKRAVFILEPAPRQET